MLLLPQLLGGSGSVSVTDNHEFRVQVRVLQVRVAPRGHVNRTGMGVRRRASPGFGAGLFAAGSPHSSLLLPSLCC